VGTNAIDRSVGLGTRPRVTQRDVDASLRKFLGDHGANTLGASEEGDGAFEIHAGREMYSKNVATKARRSRRSL
jgi:hypothetical protein